MTVIVSSEIVSDRPQRGGLRKIRERHVDVAGKDRFVQYFLPVGGDKQVFLAKHATRLESELVEREEREYISAILNGDNPFRDGQNNLIDPVYQSRNEVLSKVLNYFLSSSDATQFLSAAPFLSNLSDAELMGLLSIDQTKVDEIRAKAAQLSGISSDLSGYVPPLGA